jgi:hypothetical protein
MKERPSLALLGLAVVVALAATLPFITTANSRRDFYFFDVALTSTSPGQTQLFFDVGRGFNEPDSSVQPLRAGTKPVVYRYMMPTGRLAALRLDPIDREGTMTLADARIVNRTGRVLRSFTPDELKPTQQVAASAIEGKALRITTTPGANDPNLILDFATPLDLRTSPRDVVAMAAPVFGTVLVLVLAVAFAASRAPVRRLAARGRDWWSARPVVALAATAALAVAIQCHPVIFFGKSFVSPDNAVFLLYPSYPTLPGYQSTQLEEAKGADVGAMMWQHSAYPVVQRAALADGELPLWNRYDLTGTPLLGQGQSMFGEPLNWLSILTSGAAWSWDLRFVLMRFLFAFGCGLAFWLMSRGLAAACLVAITGVFVGFFAFRYNHPAVLSVCWAPWLLVAWCRLLESAHRSARNLSLLALGLVHLALLTSGTLKEAAMLMACLDLAGVLLVLFAEIPGSGKATKLVAAAVTGLVFVLLTAPLWLTFLDALRKSRTSYDTPAAAQVPLWQVAGFFEDLFYRQLRPDETHANPSTNVLVLLGLTWAALGWYRHPARRRLLAVALAALVPFAFVFGIMPAAWIVKLPFVANIIHIDNTFSCSLLVLTIVLAGFGLDTALRTLGEAGWWRRHAVVAAVVLGLAGIFLTRAKDVPVSPFFRGYAPVLAVGALVCPLGLQAAAGRGRSGLMTAALTSMLGLLLWRHGQYLATAFDTYVMNPKARVDLVAPSPAIAFIREREQEPSRVVGLGYTLFPGYHQHLGLESIYGVDAVRNRFVDELAETVPLRKVLDWVGGPLGQEDIGDALPLQDLMNVRYYLAATQPGRQLPGRRRLADLDLDVYESPTAWPRAFFTNTLAAYRTTPEFVALARANGSRPFAALQADELAGLPGAVRSLRRDLPARESQPATNYRLTANSTSFEVTATGPGLVVLTEAYYPGDFRVTLNGEPVAYFRVNHAFKGIHVPNAGTYRVTFRYRPEHFTLALWLAAAGALAGAGAWFLGSSPGLIPLAKPPEGSIDNRA